MGFRFWAGEELRAEWRQQELGLDREPSRYALRAFVLWDEEIPAELCQQETQVGARPTLAATEDAGFQSWAVGNVREM
ncbi:MAG: hypothetical protein WDO73_10585 [Ignavibacteriota bacterium]